MAKMSTVITEADGTEHTGNSGFGGPLDPALQTAVDNAHKKFDDGKVKGPKPSFAGQCAEIDALNKLATEIRKENKGISDEDLRQKLRERVLAGRLDTTLQKGGEAVDPCPFCAQVFRELGLHPDNNGGPKKKKGVIGSNGEKWNGNVWHKGQSKPFKTAPSSTPPFAGT